MLEPFLTHTKKLKRMTVDQVRHFVNKVLKVDIVGVHFSTWLKNHGLNIPVSRSTLHRPVVDDQKERVHVRPNVKHLLH